MSIRLTSKEQEELVLKNEKLVNYLVNRLVVANSDYEDIVSIGKIGLIKAAATYDKSKNITFGTYASRCINNEIFMHFRKEKSHANDISIYNPIGNDDEGHEITLADKIPISTKDFTEVIEEKEIFIKLINIILNLLEQKERIVMLYAISGVKQDYIAKTLNISQSYISRLEKKTKNEVKLYLKTTKQFKEVFKMEIVGDSYRISFSTKDIKQFNKIFATLLQNLTSVENLPDFKVICEKKKERVILQVPAHPESFIFIAKIIQQIDEYSISFISDKNAHNENNTKRSKVTSNEQKKITGHTNEKEKVIQYILSLENFSIKQVIEHFPNLPATLVRNVINNAKSKNLITSTTRGEYTVIKN